MQMTVQEFNMWLAYYEIQQEEKERDQINPSFGLLGEAKF